MLHIEKHAGGRRICIDLLELVLRFEDTEGDRLIVLATALCFRSTAFTAIVMSGSLTQWRELYVAGSQIYPLRT